MQSRKPLKASLPHTITLWNQIEDSVVNGAAKKVYQRTVLKHTRYEITTASTTQMAGNSRKDSLKLFVFNGVSDASNGLWDKAGYLKPEEFVSLENKAGYWSLQTGDYIALGVVEGDPEEGGITPYMITEVQPCYGMGAEVHHWEVVAK